MLQGGIDCLYRVINDNQIRPEEIEKIRVLGHPTIELPCFLHPEVNNVVDAQFNAAYVYAVVACGIPIGPEWQDKSTMKDPSVLEMMKKIQIFYTSFHKKRAL
jgi:2-methylcitrate dehydratase PrpD